MDSRVKLEGFFLIEVKDSSTVDVECGKVKVGEQEFMVDMIRRKGMSADFLPAKVYLDGKEIWNFPSEKYSGIARLLFIHNEYVLVFINKNRQVENVVPLADLPKIRKIYVNGRKMLIGGRGVYELFKFKAAAAKQLKLEYLKTNEEQTFIQLNNKLESEKKEAARIARADERKRWLDLVFSRPEVNGYSEEGGKYYGTPIVEGEWQKLPDGSRVVLVETYNDEDNTHGDLIEAFFVKKGHNGRPEKKGAKIVFAKRPEKEEPVIEAKGVEFFKIDSAVVEACIFCKEDIASLNNAGLNSGTYVALEGADDQGRYQILRLSEGKSEPVGIFTPYKV